MANVTASCSDVGVISSLIANIRNGLKYTATCGGNVWSVFQCSGQPIICVNCKSTCTRTVLCPGQSFAVTPCGAPCVEHGSAVSSITIQSTERILYPVIQSSLQVISNASNVQVLVNASKQGTVFCGAFPSSVSSQTLWDIYSQGFSNQIVSVKSLTAVTVLNLYPDTMYSILCYTEDLYGHRMPLERATKTTVSKRTLCCKRIISPTSPPFISTTAGSIAGSFVPQFYIGLNSPPISSTTLNFQFFSISCSTKRLSVNTVSNLISISPSSVTYDRFSFSIVSGFFISSTVPGCYLLQTSALGGTSYSPLNITFRVQSSSTSPSPPTLSKVLMSDDGSRLSIYFSSDTNQAGKNSSSANSKTFTCSNILDYVGVRNSTCYWSAPSSLTAYLSSSGQQPTIGSSIKLKANTITAACMAGQNCASYAFSSSQLIKITAPSNPIKPVFTLSSARQISACDDMYLDATSAQGSGGRSWIRVLWNVTGTTVNAFNQKKLSARLRGLTGFLNKQYPLVDRVVNVPNKFLNSSVSYTVSLTLTNFLLQSSTASVIINVDSSSGSPLIPQVRVTGPNGQLFRWMEITFYAAVSLPPCFSGGGNVSYYYSWSLYSNSRYLSSIQSSSPMPRLFILPSYTLSAASSYSLVSTVTVATTIGGKSVSTSGSNSIAFNVGQSGIRALISGGNQQQLSPTDPITFDASSSYDIDYPTDSNLMFLWSCMQTYPSYGLPCNLCKSNITHPVLAINCALPPGVYNVSVIVSNTRNEKFSTFTIAKMSNFSAPRLFIRDVQVKYNPSENVMLSGTLTASKPCQSQWMSADIPSSQLSRISLTTLLRTFSPGTSIFQLAIAANSLSGGVTYSFQLQASYNAQQISTASVTITMNRPPSGGSLSVTPTRGTAFNTTFTLTTYSWTDDASDLPLQYIFSYYSLDPRTERNVIKNLDLVPSVSSFLGQGLSSLGYSLRCVAFAVDVYSGQANTSTSVVVNPMKITPTLLTSMNSALNNAFAQQNIYAVTQVVNSVLSSLNGVDCSVPMPCGLLNRQICMATAKTCGPCLNGFIGITGDSNIACRPIALLNRTGEYCSRGSSCVSGICLNNPPRCADISKSCPNNCGGRSFGLCIYRSNNGDALSSCSISNPSCQAVCSCLSGRYGRDCSLSNATLSQYQALRSSICSTLLKNLGKQSMTADVVASRAYTVGNIFSDVTQITATALLNCTYVLTTTIQNNLNLACSDDTASVILQALSNVVQVGNRLPPPLFNDVLESMNLLLSSCHSSMAVGQEPQATNTANIKALSYVSDKDSDSVGCNGIQSELEKFLQVPATAMCANLSASALAAGFSVVQYLSDPQVRTSTSSSLNIQVTPVPSTSKRRALQSSDNDISLTSTFQNNELISYDTIPEKRMSSFCNGKNSIGKMHTFLCPSGLTVNATCPAGKVGTLTVVCPVYQILPQCTYWNGTQFIADSLCKVVEYTEYNTTCICASSLPSGGAQTLKLSAGTFVREGTPSQMFSLYVSQSPRTHDFVVTVTMGTLALLFLLFVTMSRFYNPMDSKKSSTFHGRQSVSVFQRMDSFFEDLLPADLVLHSWIAVIKSRIHETHIFGTFQNMSDLFPRWFDFISRSIIVFFMNIVVAAVFYGDDGSCGELTSLFECNRFRDFIPSVTFHVCSWQDYDQTCHYSADFSNPSLVFTSTVLVLVLASLPLTYVSTLLEIIVSIGRAKKVVPHNSLDRQHRSQHPDDRGGPDERASLRKVCQRAAGFLLAKRRIDNVAVDVEAFMLYGMLSSLKSDRKAYNRDPIKYEDLSIRTESLYSHVTTSRDNATKMVGELVNIASTDLKEKYLVHKFLLEFMSADSKPIAERYILSLYPSRESSIHDMSWRKGGMVVVLLVVVLAAMAYVTIWLSSRIGSASSIQWLGMGLLTIAVDVLAVQLVVMWIQWVLFVSFFKSEIRQVYTRLRDRSRFILVRSSGVVQSYKWLTQHLSPACRVARSNSVSALPASRLLRAINDFDLPPDVRYHGASALAKYVLQAVDKLVALFINCTLMLPFKLDSFVVYIYAIIVTYALGIGLTLFGAYTSWVYPVIVVVLVIVSIIVSEVVSLSRQPKASLDTTTERMALYQTQAVAIASALALADEDDLLDSDRSESKQVHHKPVFTTLSPSKGHKPDEYFSNVIVRQSNASKRNQQLQFPSPEKLPDYFDFMLPSERVLNQPTGTTTNQGDADNSDILLDMSREVILNGHYRSPVTDTNPAEGSSAVDERNALANSIEKALSQVQAQSSRERSSMQRTRRFASSDPLHADSHAHIEGQPPLQPYEIGINTNSSLLDGVVLYQATSSGTRKLVNSPAKPMGSNGLLGPSRRAHLLMSDVHPIGASSSSLPSELLLPTLLEQRLDGIGSTTAVMEGSGIEPGPSYMTNINNTTNNGAVGKKRKKRRHAGPGSQLYDT